MSLFIRWKAAYSTKRVNKWIQRKAKRSYKKGEREEDIFFLFEPDEKNKENSTSNFWHSS